MNSWERGENFLVNYKTCKKLKLNGYPIFNSDFSQVVCINYDLGDESIFINYFDGLDFIPKYNFEISQSPNRAVLDRNDNLYLELYIMWHDGRIQKKSTQYFKLERIK